MRLLSLVCLALLVGCSESAPSSGSRGIPAGDSASAGGDTMSGGDAGQGDVVVGGDSASGDAAGGDTSGGDTSGGDASGGDATVPEAGELLRVLYGPETSSTFSEPRVADLDGDGLKEVIASYYSSGMGSCTSVEQGVYVWNAAGELRAGFPVVLEGELNTDPQLCGYLGTPTIANVVGDDDLEIVLATGRDTGGIHVIDASGVVLSVIAPQVGFSGINKQSAMAVDMNNDGLSEIFAGSYGGTEVYGFYGNGDAIDGWPIDLSPGGVPIVSAFAVAQGQLVVSKWPLYVDPEAIPGIYSLGPGGELQWSVETPHPRNPLIVDVDRNGDEEIISLVKDFTTNTHSIYVLNADDGLIEHEFETALGWSYAYGVVASDLDQDGDLEILTHDSLDVYAYNLDGTLVAGYPVTLADGYQQLTNLGAADLTGSGTLEVFGTARKTFSGGTVGDHKYAIFAFDIYAGVPLGFPLPMLNLIELTSGVTYEKQFQPTYADVDGDGIGEILVASGWRRIHWFALGNYHPAGIHTYGVKVANTRQYVVP